MIVIYMPFPNRVAFLGSVGNISSRRESRRDDFWLYLNFALEVMIDYAFVIFCPSARVVLSLLICH